jgi:hypothetical protein
MTQADLSKPTATAAGVDDGAKPTREALSEDDKGGEQAGAAAAAAGVGGAAGGPSRKRQRNPRRERLNYDPDFIDDTGVMVAMMDNEQLAGKKKRRQRKGGADGQLGGLDGGDAAGDEEDEDGPDESTPQFYILKVSRRVMGVCVCVGQKQAVHSSLHATQEVGKRLHPLVLRLEVAT